METIEVLNKLIEILKWKDEDLYLYNLNKIIKTAKNEQFKKMLSEMKMELDKHYSDLTPDHIYSSQTWTTGRTLFPMDTFDYMAGVYVEMQDMITRNITDKNIIRILIPMFSLPVNYKKEMKSEFHKHSKVYDAFLDKRKDYIKKIEEMKNDCK